MKNNLYFLSIYKNGNRVIQDKVINRVKNSLNGIPIYTENKGWSLVKDDTYVISTLRHPVLRTVSHFCDYKKNILNDNTEPTIKEFAKWFDENQLVLSNYQLKNIFYNEGSNNFLLDENFKNFEIPKKMSDIKNRIRQFNGIVRIDNVRNETLLKMSQDILEAFDRPLLPFNSEHIEYNINIFSRKLAISLPRQIQIEIENLNDIEMDIYNTDSLFNRFLV